MTNPDHRALPALSAAAEAGIALGWDIMDRCRSHTDIAEATNLRLASGHAIEWDAAAIGHGDLGVAMAFSVADQLDPDGGWDQIARTHLTKAAHRLQQNPSPGLGLFAGAGGLAFALRAHSRKGQRYQAATTNTDLLLVEALDDAVENIDIESGSATSFYDVVSGIAGAVTYAFTTEAGTGALGPSALRAINVLAELALADGPGGLWTPGDKLNEYEREWSAQSRSSQLNCGFAHGIAGVLNVLSQACDRGWGSSAVADATEHLAEILLNASDRDGELRVPRVLPSSATAPTVPQRYAWCYGNLGAALPFYNSTTLRRKYPGVVPRLLDTTTCGGKDLHDGDSSLCHGQAGQLVLERIVLGENTLDRNVAAMLRLKNPRRAFLLDCGPTSAHLDSPGFLIGSGGAAAALLSLLMPADSMDFTRMLTGSWIHW